MCYILVHVSRVKYYYLAVNDGALIGLFSWKDMDNIVERGRLYDYYGGLLTEHQNLIYRAMVYDDMSLGEIAKEYNISRQGVHDLITRCDRQLKRYEEKLGLIERDMMIGSKLDKIEEIADGEQISDIVSQIRDLL